MEAELRITSCHETEDFASLWGWLRGERELRGHVRLTTGTSGDGELGGLDWITIAFGSGGIGVALTTSLNRWLENQRPDVTAEVIVTPKRRTVKLKARHANEAALALLRDLLNEIDRPNHELNGQADDH